MGAKPSRADWTWTPAGDDGFFYLSARGLFEVHRGGEAKRHLEAEGISNIIRIAPGPDSCLLLRLGKNDHGAAAVIYDPNDGSVKKVTAQDLGQKRIEGLRWSEPAGRLVGIGRQTLTALDKSMIAALPTI